MSYPHGGRWHGQQQQPPPPPPPHQQPHQQPHQTQPPPHQQPPYHAYAAPTPHYYQQPPPPHVQARGAPPHYGYGQPPQARAPYPSPYYAPRGADGYSTQPSTQSYDRGQHSAATSSVASLDSSRPSSTQPLQAPPPNYAMPPGHYAPPPHVPPGYNPRAYYAGTTVSVQSYDNRAPPLEQPSASMPNLKSVDEAFSPEEKAREAFDNADRDKSGYIDFREFLETLRSLNVNIPYHDALAQFSKLDVDKDGRICETEFINSYLQGDYAHK